MTETPKCPYCGAETRLNENNEGLYWYECRECNATGPTEKTPVEAFSAALHRAEPAFERLWNSQRKAEKKPEVREVKRYANFGEYIKIVDAESYYGENYHNGDILMVVEYYEGERDGWVMAEGANVVIDPDEYVVLEGYHP